MMIYIIKRFNNYLIMLELNIGTPNNERNLIRRIKYQSRLITKKNGNKGKIIRRNVG